MPGFFIHSHSNTVPDPIAYPLGATQLFTSGDPVFLDDNELILSCPSDGSEVLDTEFFGIAAVGALGEQAGSRTGLTYGGGGGGNATQTMRGVYLPEAGLLLRTKNFYTTAAGTVQDTKRGADRGKFYQIAANNVADNLAQWGVVDVGATIDTHLVACVVDVLDNNMQPVASTAVLTAGDGWVVFRIVGNSRGSSGLGTLPTA